MKRESIFRLSAMLYKDDNYDNSRSTIVKKIIETLFVEKENVPSPIDKILSECYSRFGITLQYKVVENIISKNPNHFKLTKHKKYNIASLQENRYFHLKQSNITSIEDYINKFIMKRSLPPESTKFIYKYLYDLFTSSIDNFESMLNNDFKSNHTPKEYSDAEKELINQFLTDDEVNKGKAIFNLVSYALEYCMFCHGIFSNNLLDNFKNKTLYLDTNILFRAIGINNDYRRKRMLTFLKRCKENGQTLIISNYTYKEFKKTIDSKIKWLGKYFANVDNPTLLEEYNVNNDIEYYYTVWAVNRQNKDLELFKAYIMSELNQLLDSFNIKTDYNLIKSNTANNTRIKDVSNAISNYKSKVDKYDTDARNIVYIENCRKTKNQYGTSLLQVSDILVSTDQLLTKWSYDNKTQAPLAILPSQWLTILLRYNKRTDDDFSSFVSFLKLNHSEMTFDENKVKMAISGICELTKDLENQKHLAHEIINNKFDQIIELENDPEIYVATKSYVKNQLEAENTQLKNQLDEAIALKTETEHEMTLKTQELYATSKEKNNLKESIDKLKAKSTNQETKLMKIARQKIHIRMLWHITCFLITFLLPSSTIFFTLFYTDKEWNLMHSLYGFATNSKYPSICITVIGGCVLLFISALYGICFKYIFLNHLINYLTKSGRQQKTTELYESILS